MTAQPVLVSDAARQQSSRSRRRDDSLALAKIRGSLRHSDNYGKFILFAGVLAVLVPTFIRLATTSWTTEAGAHGPIVLATGIWLFWHDRGRLSGGTPEPLWRSLLILAALLIVYFVGRVAGILAIEGLAAIAVCAGTLNVFVGPKVVARFAFHIFYLCFTVSPPENWIFVATRPLKEALSSWAVDWLSLAGLPLAQTATTIFIGSYRLQVAAACSGLNSIIGITAIGAFYVYIRHGNHFAYAAVLAMLMVPFAIFINFLRILALIVLTYSVGDGAVFIFVHDYGSLLTFSLAIALLVGLDSVLHPLLIKVAGTKHGR